MRFVLKKKQSFQVFPVLLAGQHRDFFDLMKYSSLRCLNIGT